MEFRNDEHEREVKVEDNDQSHSLLQTESVASLVHGHSILTHGPHCKFWLQLQLKSVKFDRNAKTKRINVTSP